MKANLNYKDSVFTSLFSEPALLRELYCALRGVTLPQDIPVSINTLEKVLFMDLYNDISFEIAGKLVVLIEHQSTVNPNMALRFLLYISRVLEKRIKGRTLYSTKQISIPYPEFYVLYNGPEKFPDEQILKLSDLFNNPKELFIPKTSPGLQSSEDYLPKTYPLLELEVKVININEGRNENIVNRCRMLYEYSVFMSRIRFFMNEQNNLEEAVKKAIMYCQRHDILEEYLEIHASEVLNMILTEWNTEDAIAYAREEGREDGILEIARKMKNAGRPISEIAEFTGLSPETIGQIK